MKAPPRLGETVSDAGLVRATISTGSSLLHGVLF